MVGHTTVNRAAKATVGSSPTPGDMRIRAKQIKVEPPDLSRYLVELCSVVRRMINRKVVYFLSGDITDPAATIGFHIYDDEEDMGYFIHEKKIYKVEYDEYDDDY